ncbi:hypothetical protein ACFX2I_012599 [Malus domestica]
MKVGEANWGWDICKLAIVGELINTWEVEWGRAKCCLVLGFSLAGSECLQFFLAVRLLIKVGKLERVGILGEAFQIRVNCSSIWECFGALNLIACLLVITCKLPRDGETDMRMWVARAELVQGWTRTEKGAGCIQELVVIAAGCRIILEYWAYF